MQQKVRWLALGMFAMLLAACGSTSTSAGTSTTMPNPTATMPASPATITTSSVMINGVATVVLTNSQGFTLYYRNDESATQVKCNGACLTAWPPILVTSGMPTAASTVTGKLTVLSDTTRQQAVYNGHPLYTFVKDTMAGQSTGQGVGGIWFVVTPDLAAANG